MAPRSGPNRLLRTLIIFSLGVHALVLMHLSGVYRSSALTCIEMTLQNIHRPTPRDIPRPRPRPRPPEPQDRVANLSLVKRPLPHFKPLAKTPMPDMAPDTPAAGIGLPALPRPPGIDTAGWVAALQAEETPGEYMTVASYLEMVRLRIESRKRYPEAAKDRSIEGRVKIRFILGADGAVRDLAIARGAPSSALNTAAMDAVRRAAPFPRPPPNLFKGDLSLELVIVFELT